MNPRDLLDVAGELCAGSGEAEWRTAVSRAYFAAFHVARLTLDSVGFDVPRGEAAHAYLWLRLSNAGQVDLAEAGRRLNDLRSQRNWADYNLNRSFPHLHASHQVQAAAEIVRMLDEAVTMPAVQTAMTAAIEAYERQVLRQSTRRPR
ncbi:MAG: hypothetical protein K2R98_12385 [Gemmataceae bacterium]|nr:hypothetical protein [Gemmataceae bacterium]